MASTAAAGSWASSRASLVAITTNSSTFKASNRPNLVWPLPTIEMGLLLITKPPWCLCTIVKKPTTYVYTGNYVSICVVQSNNQEENAGDGASGCRTKFG